MSRFADVEVRSLMAMISLGEITSAFPKTSFLLIDLGTREALNISMTGKLLTSSCLTMVGAPSSQGLWGRRISAR